MVFLNKKEKQGLIIIFMVWLLLFLAYWIPVVDSTRTPYFDLTTNFARVMYWFSESGGKVGASIISLLMGLLLVTRPDISGKRRWFDATLLIITLLVFAGGGAAINEHLVKPALAVPRPNIQWLANSDNGKPLGMSAEVFYQFGDKNSRRILLRPILEAKPAKVPMLLEIREHWIKETGYSFPSGHSYAALFFTTFLLMKALSDLHTARVRFFYLLLPWSLTVCYSRLILRVHSPTDVVFGAAEGILIGLIAWFVFKWFAKKST